MKIADIAALCQALAAMPLLDGPKKNSFSVARRKPFRVAPRKFPSGLCPNHDVHIMVDATRIAFDETGHCGRTRKMAIPNFTRPLDLIAQCLIAWLRCAQVLYGPTGLTAWVLRRNGSLAHDRGAFHGQHFPTG